MAVDVIIDPSSGQIYWNDQAGSGTQTIAISGNATNAINVVGYSNFFSPGGGGLGTQILATFNDSATSTLTPGTNAYDLGSTSLRWNFYGTGGNFTGAISTSSTTASTGFSTGALVVTGGVGIGGSLFTASTSKSSISGVSFNNSRAENGFQINATSSFTFNITDAANNQRLNYHGDSNRTEFTGNNATHEIRLIHSNNSSYTGFKANSSGTVTYTLPAGDGSNGQVLYTNGSAGLAWTTPGSSGGGTSGVTTGGQYQIAYYTATGSSVSGSSTFSNDTAAAKVSITHTTASTSTSTGALVVSGGVGIAKTSYFGQDVIIQGTTSSTTTATGALLVFGGLGVTGQINAASLQTTGNAVISGNLTFNGVGVFGNATSDTINSLARYISDILPSADNSYDLGNNALGWRNFRVSGVGTIATLQVTSVTSGVWAGTAISAVNGGTGQNTYAIGDILYASSSTALTRLAAGTAGSVLASGGAGAAPSWVLASSGGGGAGTVASGTANQVAVYAATGASVSGAANFTYNTTSVTITNTTASNNSSSGALLVHGGIGASGQISGAGASFTSTVFLNGIQIGQGGNNININDSAGTTIANFNTSNGWFRSAQTTQSTSSGTGALVSLGGLGVAKAASIGETIYGYSTVASTGWSTGGLILSGGLGVSKTSYINGNLFVTSSTGSSSQTTGALVVTGGVGIGGSLWTATTNFSSISGVGHSDSVITSGVWSGTAISAVNGGTGQNTYAIGDILYASSSTALTRLAAGTAGSVLKSNGAGTAPSWQVDATGSGGAGTVAAPTASNLVAYYPGTGASVASYNRVSINTAAASMELLAQGSLPALLVNATNGASSDSVQFKSSFGDVYWALGPTTQVLKSTNGGTLQIDASGALTITAPAALTFYNTAETFYTALTGATNATTDLTFILPTAAGTAGSVLATAGASGQLYWSAPGSGGGGSGTVTSGTAGSVAFYTGTGTTVGGAKGFTYTTSGTASTMNVFGGGGAIGTTIFTVQAYSATSVRVGIGTNLPQYELEIVGELSATNKSFVIDHPTKSGKKLRYGSLEGPENGVYVRGELKGSNIIETPDHWIGLVYPDSLTVTLTPINRFSHLYVEKIEDYKVFIADDCMNPIHCYYTVWAERKDIPKLITEY
jgi:hypothetical protein